MSRVSMPSLLLKSAMTGMVAPSRTKAGFLPAVISKAREAAASHGLSLATATGQASPWLVSSQRQPPTSWL